MKSEREVTHLLRIAYKLMLERPRLPVLGSTYTISGYIQGIQRSAGEIAILAGDSLEELEELDARILAGLVTELRPEQIAHFARKNEKRHGQ